MTSVTLDHDAPAVAAAPSPRVRRAGPAARIAFAACLALLAVLATLPAWGSSAWKHDIVQLACYLVFASMWNLLAGYGGMVSIGQQAYFGLGGYAMLVLANDAGVNPFLAVPLGAGVAALLAWPLSRIAFRLSGGYFAIGTWVLSEVVRLSVSNVAAVGGGSGTSLTALRGIERATRENLTYWLALACAAATVGGLYLFLRSQRGLALQAIRDNPVAAESQGIAVGRMKLAVYLVASLGAGLAGALYFLANLRISPDAAFSVNWSAFAIFMVMIGGLGRIEGPVVGALLFFALDKLFSDQGSLYLLGLGLLAVVSTIALREGLWGLAERRLGWSLFPTRRTLIIEGRVPGDTA